LPKRAPALLRPLVRKVSNQALTTLVNPQLKQHMAFWESELGRATGSPVRNSPAPTSR